MAQNGEGPLPLPGQTQVLHLVAQDPDAHEIGDFYQTEGHHGVLGLDLAVLGQVGQEAGGQVAGGACGVGVGAGDYCRRGADDTGEVVVHFGGRQGGAGIDLPEGEQACHTQLLYGVGPLPEGRA